MYPGGQCDDLVSVISDQLQIDGRVENAGYQARIAGHRRLQHDEVQTSIVGQVMLMIGLGFQLTGFSRRTRLWIGTRVQRLGQKGNCCFAHPDETLTNRFEFLNVTCSHHDSSSLFPV